MDFQNSVPGDKYSITMHCSGESLQRQKYRVAAVFHHPIFSAPSIANLALLMPTVFYTAHTLPIAREYRYRR